MVVGGLGLRRREVGTLHKSYKTIISLITVLKMLTKPIFIFTIHKDYDNKYGTMRR